MTKDRETEQFRCPFCVVLQRMKIRNRVRKNALLQRFYIGAVFMQFEKASLNLKGKEGRVVHYIVLNS